MYVKNVMIFFVIRSLFFQIRVQVVVGGFDSDTQACSLSQMPHIIISTPGRLEHLIKSTTLLNFSLKRAKFLILDEADKLLTAKFQVHLFHFFLYYVFISFFNNLGLPELFTASSSSGDRKTNFTIFSHYDQKLGTHGRSV